MCFNHHCTGSKGALRLSPCVSLFVEVPCPRPELGLAPGAGRRHLRSGQGHGLGGAIQGTVTMTLGKSCGSLAGEMMVNWITRGW